MSNPLQSSLDEIVKKLSADLAREREKVMAEALAIVGASWEKDSVRVMNCACLRHVSATDYFPAGYWLSWHEDGVEKTLAFIGEPQASTEVGNDVAGERCKFKIDFRYKIFREQ